MVDTSTGSGGPFLVDAIDALLGGAALVGPTETVLAVNDRFVAIVGVEAAPVAGEPLPMDAPWWLSMSTGDHTEPFRYLHPDGRLRWLVGSSQQLRSDGQLFRVLLIDDVTAQVEDRNALSGDRAVRTELARQLEDVNEQLNRANAELLRFAGAVAHDLRAPLANIEGFAEMLPEVVADLGERGPEIVRRLRENARRAEVMVTDLLAYARTVGSRGEATTVSLSGVVHWAVQSVAERLEEVGGVVRSDELPEVLANRAALRQVFLNLLENAITFRRADVPLEVRIFAVESDDPDYAEVRVVDSGVGIPVEHRRRVFELGTQVNPRSSGSGIGLASCAGVLAAIGGAIWVDDPPEGGGTTMALRMPRGAEAPPPLSGSVLIVDDDKEAAHVVRLYAESLGLQVVGEARTLAEARLAFTDLLRPPDVVVLDLSLPDGDGIGFARWLRERRSEQAILVYSSHVDLVMMELANEIGITHAIGKGQGDELIDALRDLAPPNS